MRRTAWAAALLLAASCEPARGVRNESLLATADDFFLRERYAEAAGHYEAFLSENSDTPRRAELLTRVGKCHLGAGAVDRAVASLDRALAAQPPAVVKVDATFRLGVARRMLGDVPKALEAFRATAAAPIGDRDGAGITSDELAYETAQAQFRAGDWNAGQAELAKVGASGPFGAKARARLGLKGFIVQIGAFADEGQARSAAAKVAEASVRLAPGSPPLHVVSVGPYARYENALAEAERLKASGFRDAFVLP
ncbi:MAG TPA: SPOR domain-containing protein [Planctomycetota bacterium]